MSSRTFNIAIILTLVICAGFLIAKPDWIVAGPPNRPAPSQDALAGGFENRCYYQGAGRYTTVIIKNYDPRDHITFAYRGPLDSHNAPASAAGSEAWCKSNDPYSRR